jgi:putative inorganic carbon (HCO3(-)) transporter
MKSLSYLNKTITYSFYLLFLLVPLIFFGNTSELFEFNKMWLVFGLTTIITAAWISKMIIIKKILITRTPLDIPIALFLISQIISTILSLDPHVSFWGYYSRFNGGLLSTISYIILYYAFVSNLQIKNILRILYLSLISGLCTALWGFPSHFGYDPTCLVFRGSMDTNCWTDAFRPTIRAFSTLGQPAWFAAYLSILLPLAMTYLLINAQKKKNKQIIAYAFLSVLLYVCLIFADTRAGFAAFYIANLLFWIILFTKNIFSKKTILKYFLAIHITFLICNFFYGAPISSLNKYTFPELTKKSATVPASSGTTKNPAAPTPQTTNITDSSQIRLIVWQGAIEAWKANPVFGTGVETFAYAYYQHRPVEHNLTSEWDYLYNKAHNEYLNYLTTTGIVGLATYLSIILTFIFLSFKYIKNYKPSPSTQPQHTLFTIALLTSYVTILITNFFGFSVVIINLYLFLIPAFIFLLNNKLHSPVIPAKAGIPSSHQNINNKKQQTKIGLTQWTALIITIIITGNIILSLFRYWYADTEYALGLNLNRANAYQEAFPHLQNSVNTIPDEPIYQDELATNLAILSQAFYLQKDTTTGAQLANKAIDLDNQVIKNHPNNVVFWKNRLRIFYSLATNSDPKNQTKYFEDAILSLKKSQELAPTDAKISYNLGLILGQTGNLQAGTKELQKTIQLKPNYTDAYIALGQFYNNLAYGLTSSTASAAAGQKIQDPQMRQIAIATYQYILNNLSPDDKEIKKTIEKWKE